MMNRHHIVVGSGERGLQYALECFGDAGDLGAVRVLDVEVPGSPILGIDRSHLDTTDVQTKLDLAQRVLLGYFTNGVTGAVFDDHSRFHELGWSGQLEHHIVLRIDRPAFADAAQVPFSLKGVAVAGSPRFMRRAKSAGLKVHVWTLNTEEGIFAALDAGADGVVTDEVVLARRLTSEFQSRQKAKR